MKKWFSSIKETLLGLWKDREEIYTLEAEVCVNIVFAWVFMFGTIYHLYHGNWWGAVFNIAVMVWAFCSMLNNYKEWKELDNDNGK